MVVGNIMNNVDEKIEDYKYDWIIPYENNYPIMFEENYNLDQNIYVDQSPYYNKIYDATISSVLLPVGLKRLESWMSYQIQKGSEYTFEQLHKMILVNPHLHNVIKTNLIDNLKAYHNIKDV